MLGGEPVIAGEICRAAFNMSEPVSVSEAMHSTAKTVECRGVLVMVLRYYCRLKAAKHLPRRCFNLNKTLNFYYEMDRLSR